MKFENIKKIYLLDRLGGMGRSIVLIQGKREFYLGFLISYKFYLNFKLSFFQFRNN